MERRMASLMVELVVGDAVEAVRDMKQCDSTPMPSVPATRWIHRPNSVR
jgi:hypothetical protein